MDVLARMPFYFTVTNTLIYVIRLVEHERIDKTSPAPSEILHIKTDESFSYLLPSRTVEFVKVSD